MRKFEEVREEFKKFPEVETKLPQRGSSKSAGYDFYSKENFTLWPGDSHIFWTDVKAAMFFDNVLMIFARSGMGCKSGIVPRNCVGIIDADFYNNPENNGGIGICLVNNSTKSFDVKVGDKIAQGIFVRYAIVDGDPFASSQKTGVDRVGGFGSTGR